MYKKENEVFVTSLYEIDCLIKEALVRGRIVLSVVG